MLVEALAARNAVVARAGPFNHWMAGDAARHLGDVTTLDLPLRRLQASPGEVAPMAAASRGRHASSLTQVSVVGRYAALLAAWQSCAGAAAAR